MSVIHCGASFGTLLSDYLVSRLHIQLWVSHTPLILSLSHSGLDIQSPNHNVLTALEQYDGLQHSHFTGVPYSRKLSREKTVANRWRIRNLWRKLSWIASATNYVWVQPPKTFADGPKTSKFTKVFSLESFPLYGMLAGVLVHAIYTCMYLAMCLHVVMPRGWTFRVHMHYSGHLLLISFRFPFL